jgi:D-alanyl-D-alanine carboxypeptidase/D-alanyl-D-alanine-endopeptidase (penicillin-binding protein 4)
MWDSGDSWDDSWNRKEQYDGYQAEVTALMVDGDRDDPFSLVSSRSDDPINRATSAFLDALDADNPAVTTGSAASSTVLGQVQSATVSTLLDFMLLNSDNVLAENLARTVSVQTGLDGSAASLAQAIPSALAKYGVPTQGLGIRDGSGLSALNGVPPKYVAELMTQIRGEGNDLGIILRALPVAGVSGTLSGRFTGDNAAAQGQVYAKTGWLDDEYALAGLINAADGTPLSFAFYAIRPGVGLDSDSGDAAKYALDTLATAAFRCGNNTSNN